MSKRLTELLATLTRVDPVPLAKVEQLLSAAGVPLVPNWIDFHERYAGYVLDLGYDVGVLGLVHEHGEWVDPNSVRLFRHRDGRFWGITCADIHPSYEYTLDTEGEFVGGPAESFDTWIEQFATIWTFTQTEFRKLSIREIRSAELRAELLGRSSLGLVAQASDRYSRVWEDELYLVIDDPETRELKDVWQRLGSPDHLAGSDPEDRST